MFANMFGIRDRRIRNAKGSLVVFFGVYDRESGELVETFSSRADARHMAGEARRSRPWSWRSSGDFVVVALRPEYA